MTDCIYININGRTVLYLYICMYYINIVVGATPMQQGWIAGPVVPIQCFLPRLFGSFGGGHWVWVDRVDGVSDTTKILAWKEALGLGRLG